MPTMSNSTPIPINVYDLPGQDSLGKGVGSPPWAGSWDPLTLLEHVRSGQVWLVKGIGAHGLLLEKPHTVELVEFGGAVGMAIDRDCRAVLPIGQVYLQAPATFLERQWGYRRRAHSAESLQKLTESFPSLRRAALLWQYLCQRYSPSLLTPLPDEWLGRLVGVSGELIQHCRRQGGSLIEAMLTSEGFAEHDQRTGEPFQHLRGDITEGQAPTAVTPAKRRQHHQVKNFCLFQEGFDDIVADQDFYL
jgi:hypothetical protein